MLTLLKKIFTWWNQDTFGTRLKTIFFGKLVGSDDLGIKHYLSHYLHLKTHKLLYQNPTLLKQFIEAIIAKATSYSYKKKASPDPTDYENLYTPISQ